MQTTPNLGLKKPETNEYINISDFNENADIIDAAMNTKVTASGGDISETAVNTLETIGTKFPIPAAGETIKRFLGKILTFLGNIKPLSGAINIYVATTGSDTEGTGTQENPFKTIQRAVNSVPKDLGGFKATITVADGTYDEDVYIYGVSNGNFTIKTTLGSGINDNCRVKSIQIKYCSSTYVIISGFTLYNEDDAGIVCWCSYYVRVEFCKTTVVAPTKLGLYFGETSGIVVQCLVSNKNTALQVVHGRVYSSTWEAGSSNINGILVGTGGTVYKVGVQPVGTGHSEYAGTGGQFINENGTQISGLITSGLSCTWGAVAGGYTRHGNINGVAMITIQLRITANITLVAGTSYYINGLPGSIGTIHQVPVTTNLQSRTSNCFLESGGRILFTPAVNISSESGVILFGATYLTDK